jgi:rhodanese-related sulfurtransferase
MSGSFLSEDEVDAERAMRLVASGAWLLDVRERHEWDAGHAPGAHLIPLGELAARQDELPEDDQILVICHSGGRSAMATRALLGAGYHAANVAGGMIAWHGAQGPITGAGPDERG